ncbi:MAG: (d)CMP kinase [Clostridiales bacterium]|nr:(d)CMP kinase [Clostridiales bacterium]
MANEDNKKLRIAIDGPAGAGKSTVARFVAQNLGIHHLDTGAMYRAMGLYATEQGINPQNADAVRALLPNVDIRVEFDGAGKQHILLNDRDVTNALRTEEVGNAASAVAQVPELRALLRNAQRAVGERYDIVMDGRDICTEVLPDTPHKFFVTASARERTRRRMRQLERLGQTANFDAVLADILARDRQDSRRDAAPLRREPDTMMIDTTHNSVRRAVERILSAIAEREESGKIKEES